MNSKKTTNIVLSVLAGILAIVAVVLIIVSAKTALVSSRYEPPKPDPIPENEITKIPDASDDESGLPKGELTEIWFDELFRVYYPKQLEDLYPIRAIMYGDSDTKQPPFCFCSDTITDIEIFSIADGKYDKELMQVLSLAPMETIILKVELSEQPDIGISFKDKNGKDYCYGIGRNADSSEVVLSEFAK